MTDYETRSRVGMGLEIERLTKQLAEANETLKDHGEIQADLCRQLAECQAQEKVLRESLQIVKHLLETNNR
jgi:hypothetical protein